MENSEGARVLRETARLLEIEGAMSEEPAVTSPTCSSAANAECPRVLSLKLQR
jgi:hypothetical protein